MTATRIEAKRLLPGRGKPIADGLVILEDGVISFAGAAADGPPPEGGGPSPPTP